MPALLRTGGVEGTISKSPDRPITRYTLTVLSAFILAGGRSSRMGRDKASLELDGHTLLDHTLSLARELTDSVFTVGPGRDVEDLYFGCGPLAGIHAALRSSTADLNLILAVDTPFLTTGLLRFLVSEAERASAVVTVPRVQGRLHPLCAVYHRSFATVAEAALAAGRYKIDALFPDPATRIVEESELRDLEFAPNMFDNLNTPEDWQRAQQRAGGKR